MNSKTQLVPPSQDLQHFWQSINSATSTERLNNFWGKWQVFVKLENLDDLWKKVHELTVQGKLGPSSKTATACKNSNARNENMKVIIVYTKDYRDLADVARVAWTLYEQKVFVKGELKYKTNEKTKAKAYAWKDKKPVSIYSVKVAFFIANPSQAKFTEFFQDRYKTEEDYKTKNADKNASQVKKSVMKDDRR